MIKKLLAVFIIGLGIGVGTCSPAFASELTSTTEASYNLLEGGVQSFELDTEQGPAVVTIEQEPGGMITRAPGNGTYKVSYTSPGAWSASFQVTINGGKISRVAMGSRSAITGSITSSSLARVSNTVARYYITWKKQAVYVNCGMQATISGNSLRVSAF